MVDYNEKFYGWLKESVEDLDFDVGVWYERFLDKANGTTVSYIEVSNVSRYLVDNQEISDIVYQVKVWDDDIVKVGVVASAIDNRLRKCGFRRTFTQILNDPDTQQQYKVLQYEALGQEFFDR